MDFWSMVAAMDLLAIPGAAGTLALRRLHLGLTPLEQLSYGLPLGVVAYSLILLGGASIWGLTGWTIGLPWVFCLIFAVVLAIRQSNRTGLESPSFVIDAGAETAWRDWKSWVPILVVGLLAARWVWFYSRLCELDGEGLWIQQVNVWADWARHFGDTASFVFSDNLPATEPRYLGHPFAYHYLVSITAAAMVWFGLDLAVALPLQSLLFTLLITLGLYAFFKRLSSDSRIAALALVLFFLGGGLGWWVLLADSPGSVGISDLILQSPWNRALLQESNIQVQNFFFSLIAPQRPVLYGLPLGLLVLTLLFQGISGTRVTPFAVAGVVAGLLPFAHLGTLLVLALVAPFLMALFYSRRWWTFVVTWAAVGLPQFLLQQGGEGGVLESMRFEIGWMAGDDNWLWFWVKNLGLFLPLAVAALVMRGPIERTRHRFLLAMMPLFVVVNLVVFQPWDWDNTKILLYWFIAASLLVAGLLANLWRGPPCFPGRRALVVLITLTLITSGAWEHLSQALGTERNLFLTREELGLADSVLGDTGARSTFIVGLKHNHPIPVMTGRQVLMSYPGWLWSHGIDSTERERDLRSIYKLESRAEDLIEKYGIDFVVVGPNEESTLGADRSGFRSLYPTLTETENYEIFAVGRSSGRAP
jgi:hypothetical protein